MAHPVERPLLQFLEPLLVIERQLQTAQIVLKVFTEMPDVLEDLNMNAAAHSLQLIIHAVQDLQVQLRLARQEAAAHILFTVLTHPAPDRVFSPSVKKRLVRVSGGEFAVVVSE